MEPEGPCKAEEESDKMVTCELEAAEALAGLARCSAVRGGDPAVPSEIESHRHKLAKELAAATTSARRYPQGPCKDGLYPLSLSSINSSPQALASIHSSMWHNHLGHLSSNVLAHLGSAIGSKLSFHSFCRDCSLSKFHQLPFPLNKETYNSPFHIIHSDVWASPVVSVSGFKYYVVFTDEFSRYIWIYPMRRKNEFSLNSPVKCK